MANQGKRMVNENLIAILKEMESKGVSISELADMLEAFSEGDIQEKLTAGDNISISEENVISATDTTYTAGTGIDITDGVISAEAGEVWESVVNVRLSTNNEVAVRLFTKEEITSTNVKDILAAEFDASSKECDCFSEAGVISGTGKLSQTSITGMPYMFSIYQNVCRARVVKSDFTYDIIEGVALSSSVTTVKYSHKIN